MQRPRRRTTARRHIDQSLADAAWLEHIAPGRAVGATSTSEEQRLRQIERHLAMTPPTDPLPAEHHIQRVMSLLDREKITIDYQGYLCQITAAAFDETQERVAWVECRQKDLETGFTDIAFTLHVAAVAEPRTILRAWELESYNPYFGCNVQWIAWVGDHGDHVALIYEEKHRTLLATVPLRGDAKLVMLTRHDKWYYATGVIYAPEDRTGLVESILLPHLSHATPVPTTWVENRTLPAKAQLALQRPTPELQAALLRRCFGDYPPQPLADLLIGSLTNSYWRTHPEPGSTYHSCRLRRLETPIWMPFFWYQTLAAGDDHAFLNVLEQLAAMPYELPHEEHTPLEIACESAAAYIRERATVLRETCRTRRFPDWISVYFWYDDHQLADFNELLPQFPQGFRDCYAILLRERATWRDFCEQDRDKQYQERTSRREAERASS